MGRSITANPATTSPNLGAEVAQIYSATGYQAGDLVYNLNGAYGAISDTYLTSDTFPITADVPYVTGGVIGGLTDVVESYGASVNSECAAKLTNGNIVIVYRSGTYTGKTYAAVYFKIVDINNNEIVAPTLVSTNSTQFLRGYATVVALSGGGFGVACMTSGTYISRAVYSNTGTLVSALTTASFATASTSSPKLIGTPLTNGGFAIAYTDSGGSAIVEAYSSTGAVLFTATRSTLSPGTNEQVGIAARQNGANHEILLTFAYSTSAIGYVVYNAATGAVIAGPVTSAISVTQPTVDCCLNVTDNKFVIAYLTSVSGNLQYVTLDTSHTLSGATNMITSATVSNMNTKVYVKSLSAGGFYAEANTNNYIPVSVIYNGTYVKQNANPLYNYDICSTYFYGTAFVESNNKLYFYKNSFYRVDAGVLANVDGCSIIRYMLDLSTLQYKAPSNTYVSTNFSIGSTATVPVNGYARGASTPLKASFLASSSSTQTTTVAKTSGSSNFISGQTTIASDSATYNQQMTTLANGNIAVVWVTPTSPYTVKYAVYTQAGAQVASGTVGSQTITNAYNSANIAALPNGKFVIAWVSGSGVVSYSIYSSAYSLIASGTLSLGGTLSSDSFSMAALRDNRFVVAFVGTSSYPTYAVYDDTATYITGVNWKAYPVSNITVTGLINNGFATVYWYGGAGQYYFDVFTPNSATNYARSVADIQIPGNSSRTSNYIRTSMDGRIVAVTYTTSGSTMQITVAAACESTYNQQGFSSQANSNAFGTVGNNGNGGVIVWAMITPTYYQIYANTSSPPATTITYTTNGSGTASYVACATSGYGNNMVIGGLNSSNNPTYAIINPVAQTYSVTITAGVTTSTGASLGPYSTGHYFVGVSQTACSAGGVGTVQTNGAATLNNNYSASTPGQYFDFSPNPAVFGVKGSISGRTVTMVKDL